MMKDSKTIKEKLDLILGSFEDMDFKHKLSFYVLVDFNTDIVDDLKRVYYLRERSIPAFVMIYKKIYDGQREPLGQKHVRSLGRYCNKRGFYFKYPSYWDYLKQEYSMKTYLSILNEYNKVIKNKR